VDGLARRGLGIDKVIDIDIDVYLYIDMFICIHLHSLSTWRGGRFDRRSRRGLGGVGALLAAQEGVHWPGCRLGLLGRALGHVVVILKGLTRI